MPDAPPKPSILLITQSETSSRLLRKHLLEYFTVVTAEDAEVAWDLLLAQREVVLVIGDLNLMINQFGLLERIRSAGDSWLAAIPILLLLGENDTDK